MQLLRRTWHITDARGRTQNVQGDGVIGEQPVLEPGESFEYTSGTPLETPSGFMTGLYHMVAHRLAARRSTWRSRPSAWTARTRTAGCTEPAIAGLRRVQRAHIWMHAADVEEPCGACWSQTRRKNVR